MISVDCFGWKIKWLINNNCMDINEKPLLAVVLTYYNNSLIDCTAAVENNTVAINGGKRSNITRGWVHCGLTRV